MLKEIHEQPHGARRHAGRAPDATAGVVDLSEMGLGDDELRRLRRSLHRRLRHLLPRRPDRLATRSSSWARVPVQIDVASEFRYRDPVLDAETLVHRHQPVGRDGRHARRHAARARGRARPSWRSPTSWAARPPARPTACSSRAPVSRSASRRPRRTSPRSPPSCSSRSTWPARAARSARRSACASDASFTEAPLLVQRPCSTRQRRRRRTTARGDVAERYHGERFFLYLGRNMGFGVCLEGALKLKEITYIPTEATLPAR